MTPSIGFIEGLKIIEPFLHDYGFKLDNMKTQNSSGGQFTNAIFINGRKKFIIGYRYSVGLLDYQFDNSIVMHNFYLDGLGYSDRRQFPKFQNEDAKSSFKHILSDFEYLKGDFFVGQCIELKRIAILQVKYYKEEQEKRYAAEKLKNDKKLVDNARQQFKIKNYRGCIDIYRTASDSYVMTEFDNKTLQRCKDHLTK